MIFSKEEITKLIIYFIAGATASLLKFLKRQEKSFSIFIIEIITGASVAFFLVPAIVEHYNGSVAFGAGLTWILTMLLEALLNKLQNKLTKKVEDVVDSIDE